MFSLVSSTFNTKVFISVIGGVSLLGLEAKEVASGEDVVSESEGKGAEIIIPTSYGSGESCKLPHCHSGV